MTVYSHKPHLPVPTNGHPTRKAAIIELYEAGVQQKLIALRLGCSRNAVSQAIHDYRQKTGQYVKPQITAPRKDRSPNLPDIAEPTRLGFRWMNYRKSVQGAREALKAMGAHL